MKKTIKANDDLKLAMKVTQQIWANHKYFVLACSQQDYLKIRQDLKPNVFEMKEAYKTLEAVFQTFNDLEAIHYPQLENALFHIAGYFKKYLSDEERQALHHKIQTAAGLALEQLEASTFLFDITYLKTSSLWEKNRKLAFNRNTSPIKHQGVVYQANELIWVEDKIIVEQEKN